MGFASLRVEKIWGTNYHTAIEGLGCGAKSGRLPDQSILTKARALADEQTKREIRDADAWQRFTQSRVRDVEWVRTRPESTRRPGRQRARQDAAAARKLELFERLGI